MILMSPILILENDERGSTGPWFWFLRNVTVPHGFRDCIMCWQMPPLSPAHLLWKLLLSNSYQCCISSSPFSWRLRHCSKVLFSNTFCFTDQTCLLIFLLWGKKNYEPNQHKDPRKEEWRKVSITHGALGLVWWRKILWQLIDFICYILSFCHFRTDFCYLVGDERH